MGGNASMMHIELYFTTTLREITAESVHIAYKILLIIFKTYWQHQFNVWVFADKIETTLFPASSLYASHCTLQIPYVLCYL